MTRRRLSRSTSSFIRWWRKPAPNRAIVLAREALTQLFYPAFKAVLAGVEVASTRLLAAHEAIAEAIADSDVETTRKWMERHINDFRKGYEMSGFDIDRSVEAPTKEK